MRRLVAGLVLLVLIIALEALFSVPFLAAGTALGLAGMAAAAVLICLGGIWLGRERLRKLLAAFAAQLERLPRGVWIGLVLLLGIALRLLWVNLVTGPPPPESQTLTDLAAQLARGDGYRTPLTQTWAVWPPGYPLLLAATFLIAGANAGSIVLLNLVLFAGTVMSTDALARRLAGDGPARLAVLLLAVWPNLIATTGIASREILVLFLLTTALTIWLDAGAAKPGIAAGSWLAAGFALGLATLTEPAFLLLPAALILHDLLAPPRPLRALAAWFLLLCGVLTPIAPWIVRNDRVLHHRPILTTGGGPAFYRANNPLATGGPTDRGEKGQVNQTELDAMTTGYRWGAEWIAANPGRFLKLALRKQVLLLGGDTGWTSPGLKALANTWWWLLWLLILLTLLTWSRPEPLPPGALLLLLTILYVWLVYSVFESGMRQHVPLAGVLAVVAALGARAQTMKAASLSVQRSVETSQESPATSP
jgi:4-amino-4-deoxy-L-arabinose transferase-like glycosyltransferase